MRARATFFLLFVLFACSRGADLPELYPVPSASLISHQDRKVNLDEMKGSVAIYDFIFTSCPGPCPLMTRQMKRLSKEMAGDERIRFVSISVDPAKDTPAVLAQYAAAAGAGPHWLFLTGPRKTIIDLSVEGFKLAAGPIDTESRQPIFHSTKFVLADQRGIIRGYYDSTSPEDLKSLRADARALARSSS